jgi:hypothetical protein
MEKTTGGKEKTGIGLKYRSLKAILVKCFIVEGDLLSSIPNSYPKNRIL